MPTSLTFSGLLVVRQAKQERKMTWGQVWLSLDLGEVPASPEVQTSMPEYTNEDEDEDDEDENG